MPRKQIAAALMVVCLLFLVSQARTNAQQEEIVIDHVDVFKSLQRPPVKFDHAGHFEIYSDCVQCHHVYEKSGSETKNVWSGEGQSCSECHSLEEQKEKPPLMVAYHDNCLGCHRRLIGEGKKTGALMCGECHVIKR